ncbi:MAG: hypothetical protein PVH64_05685 [Bacillota bacterium]|jgi:hypothetical protein
MNNGWGFVASLLVGVGWQLLTKWTSAKNWGLSFLMVLIAPPLPAAGLLIGIWICAAFFDIEPNWRQDLNNNPPRIGWKEVVVFSLWTFAGFLITLLLFFKLKLCGRFEIEQYNRFAWTFLLVLELCLLRVIARLIPSWSRTGVGVRMGFLNFLFLLYWLYPYGWRLGGLILLTLLVAFPILLGWLAFSPKNDDLTIRERNK